MQKDPLCLMDSAPLALERLLQWAKIAYMGGLVIAAGAMFAIYYLSARVTAAKDRELEEYRIEGDVPVFVETLN